MAATREAIRERSADTRAFRVDPAEHVALVWTVAGDMQTRRFPRRELVGPGFHGLLDACRDYDERRGEFARYAAKMIRWKILKAIRELSRPVYVPEWARAAVRKGVTPESPGLSPRRRPMVAAATGAMGLRPYRTEDRAPRDMPDPRPAPEPDDEAGPYLGAPVEALHPILAEVIRRRFGLDGYAPQTLREAGRSLGLGRMQVHRLEAMALERLRAAMDLPSRGGPPGDHCFVGGRRVNL